MEYIPFVRYGPYHLGTLGLTLLLIGAFCFFARRDPESKASHAIRWGLAILLLLSWPIGIWSNRSLNLSYTPLPMHLCDWAAVICAIALLRRSQRFAELAWFFGLAGTLQGLITPELMYEFPHPRFIAFFLMHSGVVISAVVLVVGFRLYPGKWGFLRAFGWLQVYTVCAALTNLLQPIGNYGFLVKKPSGGSIMDSLGPWPWYILSLEGLALVLFLILSVPFWLIRPRVETA